MVYWFKARDLHDSTHVRFETESADLSGSLWFWAELEAGIPTMNIFPNSVCKFKHACVGVFACACAHSTLPATAGSVKRRGHVYSPTMGPGI